jgi:hypothetical protein
VRPHEVVIAAKQLQVIFETLLPSRVVDRPFAPEGQAKLDILALASSSLCGGFDLAL